MTICERLFSTIESKGLKVSDLCRAIGVSTSTTTNWKQRNTDPPAKYIFPICEFLGVSSTFLLTGEEDTAQPSKVAPAAFQSHIDPELLDLISQMNEREQIKLCERAQEILDRRQSDRGDSEAAV